MHSCVCSDSLAQAGSKVIAEENRSHRGLFSRWKIRLRSITLSVGLERRRMAIVENIELCLLWHERMHTHFYYLRYVYVKTFVPVFEKSLKEIFRHWIYWVIHLQFGSNICSQLIQPFQNIFIFLGQELRLLSSGIIPEISY